MGLLNSLLFFTLSSGAARTAPVKQAIGPHCSAKPVLLSDLAAEKGGAAGDERSDRPERAVFANAFSVLT